MKLNYAPQAGLRRRKPDHHRQRWAFWGGIGIMLLFELVLMAKTWPIFHGPSWDELTDPPPAPAFHWPWMPAQPDPEVVSQAD